MRKTLLKIICLTLVLSTAATHSAFAAFIPNSEALSSQQSRTEVLALLENEAVRDQLVAMGITPLEAEQRIAALSDAQIQDLKNKLDEIPAGEGAVGAVLGVFLVVFLVLLFTDIIGETDVYDFDD